MQNEDVIPISSDFKVTINYEHPVKEISQKTKSRINEIWKNELVRAQGKLFNGKLLSADTFDGQQLSGHFVEYKHYLAQTRDPSLENELNIQPICVSGYTTADDYILIGKRAGYVTNHQNFFELVPSGGIDPSAVNFDSIDIIKQLRIELKEEAGINASMVNSIILSYLIKTERNQYEICAKIKLDISAINHLGERDEEYTELLWVAKDRLPAFIEQHRQKIIPLSLQILSLMS